ncbi:MAG: hypothetical protein ACI9I0_002583, partial [Rhodoferax sp.]
WMLSAKSLILTVVKLLPLRAPFDPAQLHSAA